MALKAHGQVGTSDAVLARRARRPTPLGKILDLDGVVVLITLTLCTVGSGPRVISIDGIVALLPWHQFVRHHRTLFIRNRSGI